MYALISSCLFWIVEGIKEETKESLASDENGENEMTGKDRLSMVVVGHVDAGKSTLMGQLLRQLGKVIDLIGPFLFCCVASSD